MKEGALGFRRKTNSTLNLTSSTAKSIVVTESNQMSAKIKNHSQKLYMVYAEYIYIVSSIAVSPKEKNLCVPPGILCTLCCTKKYTIGTMARKNLHEMNIKNTQVQSSH